MYFYLFLLLFSVIVCVLDACVWKPMWRSEENIIELILSLRLPGLVVQLTKLCGKYFTCWTTFPSPFVSLLAS